jgi:hypothetical protein
MRQHHRRVISKGLKNANNKAQARIKKRHSSSTTSRHAASATKGKSAAAAFADIVFSRRGN